MDSVLHSGCRKTLDPLWTLSFRVSSLAKGIQATLHEELLSSGRPEDMKEVHLHLSRTAENVTDNRDVTQRRALHGRRTRVEASQLEDQLLIKWTVKGHPRAGFPPASLSLLPQLRVPVFLELPTGCEGCLEDRGTCGYDESGEETMWHGAIPVGARGGFGVNQEIAGVGYPRFFVSQARVFVVLGVLSRYWCCTVEVCVIFLNTLTPEFELYVRLRERRQWGSDFPEFVLVSLSAPAKDYRVGPFVRDCEAERLFLCCVIRVGYWPNQPVVRSRVVASFPSDSCFATCRGSCVCDSWSRFNQFEVCPGVGTIVIELWFV
ncbi:hypothetical protein Taro_005745 [Colocasia esculenta]|uniref:Uncharacterized protein n=1 Tax=Colocasia esculenta TaxID=4460 RepID=A0A843TQN7_COLES|nr:hypothetical protein [Colocasia esculenta]